MRYLILSDSHLKHEKMLTYCQRPEGFTELIHKNCMNRLGLDTTLIHLGDVGISNPKDWIWMVRLWPGRKILIRGNHDRKKSCAWWVETAGFDACCDGMLFRGCWLTHEPAQSLPEGAYLNVFGHLHNIWDGFHRDEDGNRVPSDNVRAKPQALKWPWQRLFALEYCNYAPIEFEHFISHPDKYQSRGPIKQGAKNG
jgi:calcineurin-like phosphoesterase family protein